MACTFGDCPYCGEQGLLVVGIWEDGVPFLFCVECDATFIDPKALSDGPSMLEDDFKRDVSSRVATLEEVPLAWRQDSRFRDEPSYEV